MKRITAFIFLVIVNIILLAHAVFPHHHHDSQVCLFDDHCSDDKIAHNHDTDKHGHEHDGNESALDCMLDNEVIIPSNSFRYDCQNLISNADYDVFDTILINSNISIADNLSLSSNSPPCLIKSLFFVHVGQCFGLRAPPLV